MPLDQDYQNQIFQLLKQDNWWRIFVDGKRQHASDPEAKYGWMSWAIREPASLKKMKDAAFWLFSPEMLQTPLSLELFYNIHQKALSLDDALLFSWESTKADNNKRWFGKYEGRQKKELEARAKFLKELTAMSKLPYECSGEQQLSPLWNAEEIAKAIPIIAAHYNKAIAGAIEEEQKLKLIVQTAQDIERIHPMLDGNCRVAVNLWMNKELLAHGMSPAIMEDPNDFDNLPIAQLLEEVQKGQATFQRLVTTGLPYLDSIPDDIIRANVNNVGFKSLTDPSFGRDFGDHPVYFGTYMMLELLKQDTGKIIAWGAYHPNPTFSQFCNFYQSLVVANLKQFESSPPHFNIIKNANKFDHHYFQAYCKAKGHNFAADQQISSPELAALAINFITNLREKVALLMEKHEFSYLHPDLCHLSKADIHPQDILKIIPKNLRADLAIKYCELQKSVMQDTILQLVQLEDAEPSTKLKELVANIIKSGGYDSSNHCYQHFLDVVSYTAPELLGYQEEEAAATSPI